MLRVSSLYIEFVTILKITLQLFHNLQLIAYFRISANFMNALLDIPNDSASEAAIPVFNELAKEFQSNRTIKFGRMNIGLNDGEVGDILKVPSVKMFLTNGKVRKAFVYDMSSRLIFWYNTKSGIMCIEWLVCS